MVKIRFNFIKLIFFLLLLGNTTLKVIEEEIHIDNKD